MKKVENVIYNQREIHIPRPPNDLDVGIRKQGFLNDN